MVSTTLPAYQRVPEVIRPDTDSFQHLLGGPQAFYRQPDYVQTTKSELSQRSVVPTSYQTDTESKIFRIFKEVLSYLIFPVAIYNWMHRLVAPIFLPSSNSALYPENYADRLRGAFSGDSEWKYKRITIEVDGYKIDAAIMGRASTLANGRWVLASNGNGELYEQNLVSPGFRQILSEVEGNGLIFNYPGVGASSGPPGREAMAKAYKAMLRFLEDKKKGIGAREIIGYGHSIGGGVQGDALLSHPLQQDVKYVFVKSRTFTNLSDMAFTLVNRYLPIIARGLFPSMGSLSETTTKTVASVVAFVVKMLGWNIASTHSSKALQAPEIIMQTARVDMYEGLQDSTRVIDDGIIPPDASLAKALLDDPSCPRTRKVFLGMPEMHNEELRDPAYVARTINRFLRA